jgi:glucokinase
MSVVLGMDFGGTAVKLGLVTAEGSVLARTAVAFDPERTFEETAAGVCEAGARLAGDRQLRAIGIATPGYADPATGVLVDGTNNVPALRGQSLPAFVQRRFAAPAFIENDGTCATLGEMLFGAGRPFSRFVLVTLGTGIGGGVVIERRIVTGPRGMPPEIGALCLDADGPTNYSGIPGTFERLASAGAFVECYARRGGRGGATSAGDVFRLAGTGDGDAAAAIAAVSRVIAQALGIMINLLNLEACIIGGGISAAGAPLLEAVRSHLSGFTWAALHRNVQVLLGQHGNDAGILGAAAMAATRAELR